MRVFAGLLLAVLSATHGAWAGPAPWAGPDAREVRIECAGLPGTYLLPPSSVVERSAAAAARDGAEGMDAGTSRVPPPQDDPMGAVYLGSGTSGDAVWALPTRSCLLGFRGHPSTAPPSRT